jgi:RNA polymerase sigma-70 factor (ECF subfamily)
LNAPRLPVDLPDEALVARVVHGDVGAFEVLYDRYARPVYTLATYLLDPQAAEESVQEVFLRLWHRAGQFDPTRGVFAAWFMAIARHHVRAELRRRGREQQLTAAGEVEAVLAAVQDPDPEVDDIVWSRNCAAAVRKAMRDLPPDQRQAVVMAYFGDLSHREIAEAMGWPLGTVKKRIQLGMAKLRAALEATGDVQSDLLAATGRATSKRVVPKDGQVR